MYAIIRTGGKQYKVAAGDEVLVEKLDAEVGAEVAFEVLMLCGDEVVIGKPVVEGVSAKGKVVEQGKGKRSWCSTTSPRRTSAKSRAIGSPIPRSLSRASANDHDHAFFQGWRAGGLPSPGPQRV